MASGNITTEKLYLRTEMQVPLTTLQNDENHQFVSNPWKTGRAYKVGMIVYMSLEVDTDGDEFGNLAWYICQEVHTAGTFATDLSSNYWKMIGAGSGTNMVINGTVYPGITLGTGLGIDDCGVLSNTAAGYWEAVTGGDTIYYGPTVLIGDSVEPTTTGDKLQVVGDVFITGNITISGTVDGVDLSGFFGIGGGGIASGETWDLHRHTLGVDNTYHSQLADVDITALADDDILQYDGSTNKWKNIGVSVLSGTHTFGAGQTDVNASVSTAPVTNQILYYDGVEWNRLTVASNTATGLSGGPFSHAHDNRYYTESELDAGQLDNRYFTETELGTSGGAAIHFNNITNLPTSLSGDTLYSGDGVITSDREVFLGGYNLSVIQGSLGSTPTPGGVRTAMKISPLGFVGMGTLTQAPAAPLEIFEYAGTDDTQPHFRISVKPDSSIHTDFTVQEFGPAGSLLIQPSGSGSVKIQPKVDNLNAFQVLQRANPNLSNLTIPVFNVDTTNRRAGVNSLQPSASFHVQNGEATELSFLVSDQTTGQQNFLLVTGDGKVGINTEDNTPDATLEVNGDLMVKSILNETMPSKVLTVDGSGIVKYRTIVQFTQDLGIMSDQVFLQTTSGDAYANQTIRRIGMGLVGTSPNDTPEAVLHIKSESPSDFGMIFKISDGGTNDGTLFSVEDDGIVAFNHFRSANRQDGPTENGTSNITLLGGKFGNSLSFGLDTLNDPEFNSSNATFAMTHHHNDGLFGMGKVTLLDTSPDGMHAANGTSSSALPAGRNDYSFMIDDIAAPNSLRVGAAKASSAGDMVLNQYQRPAVSIGVDYGKQSTSLLDSCLTIENDEADYNILTVKDGSTADGIFYQIDGLGTHHFHKQMMTGGGSAMTVDSRVYGDGYVLPSVSIGAHKDLKTFAALTIVGEGQHPLIVTDGSTSSNTALMVDQEGNVLIGTDHDSDTGSTNARLYVQAFRNSDALVSPEEEIAFRIDNNDAITGLDNTPFIVKNGGAGDTDFYVGINKAEAQYTIDAHSDGNGQIRISSNAGSTVHVQADKDITDASGTADAKISLQSGSSFIWGIRNDQDDFAPFWLGQRGDKNAFTIAHNSATGAWTGVNNGQFAIQWESANYSIQILDNHARMSDMGTPGNVAVMMGDSHSTYSLCDTGTAPTLTLASNVNAPGDTENFTNPGGSLRITDGTTGDDVHFVIGEHGTAAFHPGQIDGTDSVMYIEKVLHEGQQKPKVVIGGNPADNHRDHYGCFTIFNKFGDPFTPKLGTPTDHPSMIILDGSTGDDKHFEIDGAGNMIVTPFGQGQTSGINSSNSATNSFLVSSYLSDEIDGSAATRLKPAVKIGVLEAGTNGGLSGEGDAALTIRASDQHFIEIEDNTTASGTIFRIEDDGHAYFGAGQVYSRIYQDEQADLDVVRVIDWNDGNVQRIDLAYNTHYNFSFKNQKAGASYTLFLHQEAGGAGTADFEESTGGFDIYWQSGVHPQLTTTPGAVDIITFVSDGTNLYGAAGYNFSRVNVNND